MRVRGGCGWILMLACGVASAQPPAPSVPPLVLPSATDSIPLGNGTTVSRPLEAVILDPTPPFTNTVISSSPVVTSETTVIESSDPPTLKTSEAIGPLGPSWSVYEYLLWWPQVAGMPPLATVARANTPPVLGGPNTVVLLGNGSLAIPDMSGARFTWGWSINPQQTAGLEFTYFFLGSRMVSASVTDVGNGAARTLGRPVWNPRTMEEDVVLISSPGTLGGSLNASLTTRLTGWEITGVANLMERPGFKLNALGGYRYFMLNEGLSLQQTGWMMPSAGNPNGQMFGIADQFDAHNRFHGCQIGLHTDITHGSAFLEFAGKVGFGQTTQVVRVSGQSVAVTPNVPPPMVQYYEGGVLGQMSNSGRFAKSVFAVLPEAIVKVGYRFQDRSRLYLGYNFLYLSDVVRPGDQIDRAVDPAQVPIFAGGAPSGGSFSERPLPTLARTDFWVQGLVFGMEFRY